MYVEERFRDVEHTEKGCHTGRHLLVVQLQRFWLAAHDVDHEDHHWREQDDLEDAVERD